MTSSKINITDPFARALFELLGMKPVSYSRGNYMVLCPLHNDTVPSMSINPIKGQWRCFGKCSRGGGLPELIVKTLDVSYALAYKKLEEIGLEDHVPSQEGQDLDEDLSVHKPFIGDMPAGRRVNGAYRGIESDVLATFGVYVARLHDGQRCIIPVHNEIGQLVGYQARALENQAKKYMFSTGTEAHLLLYNYHRVALMETLYVVEGAFSVMNFYMHGIKNVVALFGSHCTPKKRCLLQNHGLILCLDNDEAGNLCADKMESDEELIITRRICLPLGLEFDKLTKENADKYLTKQNL